MPRHQESKLLPYAASQMFDLVADIESYPLFLPWCQNASILERDEKTVLADLVVGNRFFSEKFRSMVYFDKPRHIKVVYGGGPLERLANEWTFKPVGKSECEISFFVDFRIKSLVLGAFMDAFFDKAYRRMALAFEERAQSLYG